MFKSRFKSEIFKEKVAFAPETLVRPSLNVPKVEAPVVVNKPASQYIQNGDKFLKVHVENDGTRVAMAEGRLTQLPADAELVDRSTLLDPEPENLSPNNQPTNNVSTGLEGISSAPEAGLQSGIEQAKTPDQLNEALLSRIQSLERSLALTQNNIQEQVMQQLQLQLAELQPTPELSAQIAEVTNQEKQKNKEKGRGFLKGFKDNAKKAFGFLNKKIELTPKQMKALGIALAVGGVALGGLFAAPVIAALTGGTAGALVTYGTVGLAAGINGSLLAAPVAATLISTISTTTAGVGAYMAVKNSNIPYKTPEKSFSIQNSPTIESNKSQPTIESKSETPNELPAGFESNEQIKSVDINKLSVGTEMRLNVTLENGTPGSAMVVVAEGVNGERVLKFTKMENAFAKVSTVDSHGIESAGVITNGQPCEFEYENGQTRTLTINGFDILGNLGSEEKKKPEGTVNTNENSEIQKLEVAKQSLLEYNIAFEKIKTQVDSLDTAIESLSNAGLDTKNLEDQKAKLLEVIAPQKENVIKNIVPISQDLNKAISTIPESRTELQKKQAQLVGDLKKAGFEIAGGTNAQEAVLINNSTLKSEKKVETTGSSEIKPSVENQESGIPNIPKTIRNFDQIQKTIESNSKIQSEVDSTIEALLLSQDPKIDIKELLGLDKTASNGKVEDLIKTSLVFADIHDFGTKDTNLQFLKKTSQSFEDGVNSNPQFVILKDYRGANYDSIQRMVENLSQAKIYQKLEEVKKQSNKFDYRSSLDGRERNLELGLKILDTKALDTSNDILKAVIEKQPELSGVLTKENIQNLYDNNVDSAKLSADERRAIARLPYLIGQILKNEPIEENPKASKEVITNVESADNQIGDTISLKSVNGNIQEGVLYGYNKENGIIDIKIGEVVSQINISEIQSFRNISAETRKAELKKKEEDHLLEN
jgi:hypothetical protein